MLWFDRDKANRFERNRNEFLGPPERLLRLCRLFRGARLGGCLLSLAMPVHQLFDARLEAPRAVRQEAQFGDVAHAHPLLEFIADVALGGFQAGHGLFLAFTMSWTALSMAT